MITKLRKKVFINKLQSGGLPVPYQNAPLFSRQGLRQAAHTAGSYYNRLPGYIKKPINFVNPITKNPYVLGGYGLLYGINKYIDRDKPDPNMTQTSLKELGISPLADAQKTSAEFDEMMASAESIPNPAKLKPGRLPGEMIEVYEKVSQYAKDNNIPYEQAYSLLVEKVEPVTQIAPKKAQTLEEAFPGMSGSEIIESINKNEEDSGINIAPDAESEVINNALENNQMEQAEIKPENNNNNNNNQEILIDENGEEIDTSDAPIMSDVEIHNEYKNRDNQNNLADQMIEYNFFPALANAGRSPYALQLDNLVKDIMGPESKKSKNLLLLQLAANLMTNRTDQPGFKGFVDVLGQAGQQVIPMALALETQRRKDDLELKKALIANKNSKDKATKWGPKDKIVRFKMPKYNEAGEIVGVEEEVYTAIARISDTGEVEATVTDRDGSNPRAIDVTNFDYRIISAPDTNLISKYNDKITQKVNALKGTKEALAIIQARPELIGSKGTVALYGQAALDIMRSWAGKQTFQKFFSDINRDKTQFMNNQKIARDEAAAANPDGKLTAEQVEFFDKEMRDGLEWFENTRSGLAASMDSTTDLQIKAKLKTTELLTSYALANLLKNEDRLAVQDIKRAEKATQLFGILQSPEMAIAKYLTLEKNLTDAIANDMKIANTLGIQNDQIVAYNEGYTLTQSGSTEEQTFRNNLQTILSQAENLDEDVINSMSNQLFEGFSGAIIGDDE